MTRYLEGDVEYFLPEYGEPVRWVAGVVLAEHWDHDQILRHLPRVNYYECDASDHCCRAIGIFADGRFRLAYPGHNGPDLPEGPLPKPHERTDDAQFTTREMTSLEFNALWEALQKDELDLRGQYVHAQ